MPSRRNFLKGLAVGAAALGIGTVEAVKAAPVAPPDDLTVDLTKVDPTMTEHLANHRRIVDLVNRGWMSVAEGRRQVGVDEAEIEQSWLLHDLKQDPAIQELLRKQVLAQLSPMYALTIDPVPTSYSYVDPASIWPVWKDGQLSEVVDVSPPVGPFDEDLAAQVADALDEVRFLPPQPLGTSRPYSFTPIYHSEQAIKAGAKLSGLMRYRDT